MVSDYLKVVKPALFSWDAYWQMHEEGELRYYFDNLEVVRRNCLKAKVPFNQIIVSLAHMGYRECSEGDLRWQVWTSLAYGSRGIQYFTYVHVPGMATGDAPGLLDKYGNRDQKYGFVQKINQDFSDHQNTPVRFSLGQGLEDAGQHVHAGPGDDPRDDRSQWTGRIGERAGEREDARADHPPHHHCGELQARHLLLRGRHVASPSSGGAIWARDPGDSIDAALGARS
jgi:hypothetical protein